MNTHIGVEQTVPPGWSISVKPVAEQAGPDGTVLAQVHIFIKGAPAGTLFQQQVLQVGQDKPETAMEGISVGKDGILMCAGRNVLECGDRSNPDDPIEFTTNSIKGEPFRYLFSSAAGTIGTVIVPNPVGNRDKGCSLSAVRLTPRFEVALLTAVGFPPNSDIHYTATPGSNGTQVMHTDARGVARFSLIPFAKAGQKSGTLKVKIVEPQCSPGVSYDWGR